MSKERESHQLVFRKQTEVLVRVGDFPGRRELPAGATGTHLVHASGDRIVLEIARESCAPGQTIAIFVSVHDDSRSQEVEVVARVESLHDDDHDNTRVFATLSLVGVDEAAWGTLIATIEAEQEHLQNALRRLRE